MSHREGGNPPAGSSQHGACGDRAQPITDLMLGTDRVREMPPGKGHGLATADHLEAAEVIELECCQETRQSSNVIEMKVGQQHMTQPAEAEPGPHHLALGALAAVDEEARRPTRNDHRRQAPLGGGYGRGSAKKAEFEHLFAENTPSLAIRGSQEHRATPQEKLFSI